MHPVITQDVAKLYLDALYREASDSRLAASARQQPSKPSISLSERVLRFLTGARTVRQATAIKHA